MAGRPSLYHSNVKPRLEEIKAWCRDGYTDKVICEALQISVTSFCKYKNEYPELVKALKVTKDIADQNVVNSLYKRAMGYEFEELKEKGTIDKDGKFTVDKNERTTKQIAPDVTAQIFWLKNRRPDLWRDKPDPDKDQNTAPIVKVEIVAVDGRKDKSTS